MIFECCSAEYSGLQRKKKSFGREPLISLLASNKHKEIHAESSIHRVYASLTASLEMPPGPTKCAGVRAPTSGRAHFGSASCVRWRCQHCAINSRRSNVKSYCDQRSALEFAVLYLHSPRIPDRGKLPSPSSRDGLGSYLKLYDGPLVDIRK
jgi:hypothetical protein